MGDDCASGAFFSPTLILCRNGMDNDAVHDVEAFGPVSTMMTYRDIDEALHLAARGKGSLVTTLVTKDPAIAAHAVPVAAASTAACTSSTAWQPSIRPATVRRCRS